MYPPNAIRQAKALVIASEKIGAKLPAPVALAYERAARIAAASQRIHGSGSPVGACATLLCRVKG